jgi:putative DNA primase/helicase
MWRRGMSEDAIAAALLFVNAQQCDPPLPEDEVWRIVKNITRYAPGDLLPHGAFPQWHDATVQQVAYLTDLGNARRLVTRHGPDLRFCPPWKQWLVWTGTRWGRDGDGEVMRRAKHTVEQIPEEAAALQGNSELVRQLLQHATGSQSAPRLSAMITLATSEPGIPVVPGVLDADPWLLNVANGTLELRTGQLRAHCREDLLTKVAPVAYDPEALCPRWVAFLEDILQGNSALIAFLQRAVGYALTGDTSEQVLFLLYGTGSNGKSTLLETLRALLGAYAQHTPFTTFLTGRSDTVRNDLARLHGARFVSAVEVERGQRLDETVIKQVTGGDPITARFLYEEYFEFTPQFKLFLAANHKPVIWGTEYAIWRRIRLIPFTVKIPESQKDRQLSTKLRAELPGILTWAVQGCLAWQREGLQAPEEVEVATEEYREEMDIVGRFLDDCCREDPTAKISTQQLYQAYTTWCDRSGEPRLGMNTFSAKLSERGFQKCRLGNSRGWAGLTLRNEWEEWKLRLPRPSSS